MEVGKWTEERDVNQHDSFREWLSVQPPPCRIKYDMLGDEAAQSEIAHGLILQAKCLKVDSRAMWNPCQIFNCLSRLYQQGGGRILGEKGPSETEGSEVN